MRQFSLVSLAKLFWVVISLSLWICFGGEFIYPFLILGVFLFHVTKKYIHQAIPHSSYWMSLIYLILFQYQLTRVSAVEGENVIQVVMGY